MPPLISLKHVLFMTSVVRETVQSVAPVVRPDRPLSCRSYLEGLSQRAKVQRGESESLCQR